jgi:hypothetical protein
VNGACAMAAFSFGPTGAIEVSPIENWLEIEAGVTPLFSRGARQWGTDLLFKKPYTLSDNVEFMFGVGPSGFLVSFGSISWNWSPSLTRSQ